MKFHTLYTNPPPKPTVKFEQPSLAVQSEKDMTDVHNILSRFIRTGDPGYLPGRTAPKPIFGDFSELPDFQEAKNSHARLQEYFDTLPSHLRLKFGNDALGLVHYLNDASNHEEALKYGLLEKMPDSVKEVVQTESVNSQQELVPLASQPKADL